MTYIKDAEKEVERLDYIKDQMKNIWNRIPLITNQTGKEINDLYRMLSELPQEIQSTILMYGMEKVYSQLQRDCNYLNDCMYEKGDTGGIDSVEE